jgi:flavin reductase (DIM6/NTAB) family NADH-FMN oxidoreductase RutF
MNSTIDSKEYRNVIGLFATGVTVVAAEFEGELQTMTANAISSVSLDPVLLLICVGKKLALSASLGQTEGFTVNILRQDQEALSNYFADLWHEEDPPSFRFEPWEGIPRLSDCIASLRCVPHEVFEGGDHRIVVGRVVGLHLGAEPYLPLLYYGGRYGKLVHT